MDKNILILSGCFVVNEKKEVLLLFRKDHKHYETPGGKVRKEECLNFKKPTIKELVKTAERELHEELGTNVKIKKLKYFSKAEFIIPEDGRRAVANTFITSIITGKPKLAEPEVFRRFDWLPIEDLDKYPISPNLKMLYPKIRRYFNRKKKIKS